MGYVRSHLLPIHLSHLSHFFLRECTTHSLPATPIEFFLCHANHQFLGFAGSSMPGKSEPKMFSHDWWLASWWFSSHENRTRKKITNKNKSKFRDLLTIMIPHFLEKNGIFSGEIPPQIQDSGRHGSSFKRSIGSSKAPGAAWRGFVVGMIGRARQGSSTFPRKSGYGEGNLEVLTWV